MGYLVTQGLGALPGNAPVKVDVPFLIAQLNRFTALPPARKADQVNERAFPTSSLTPDIALSVLILASRRAARAQASDLSERFDALLAESSDAGRVAFVETNLRELAGTLQGFADSLGLPPAKPTSILGLPIAAVAAVAAVVLVGGFMYLRRK